MKTNRKTRPQPSLAPLTTDEYHQLADMVRTRTYGDILQQINKPRAEGGFDLDISIKPLQVLHRRVTELDRLNQLIADGQKLTLTAYDELQAGQTPPTEQIHNAILNAAWFQVQYSENTPHQLLALQRLADFPVRAEIRENREQIYQEKHTHKMTLDLRKQTHKEKTAAFKQDLAQERLALSKLRLNRNPFSSDEDFSVDDSFSGTQHSALKTQHFDCPTSNSRDAIPSNSATPADMKSPGLQTFSDSKSDIKNQNSEIETAPFFRNPLSPPDASFNPQLFEMALNCFNNFRPSSSSPFSPEVQRQNVLYSLKFDCGELRIVHNPERFAAVQYCNPADKPFFAPQEKKELAYFRPDPSRTLFLPALTPDEAPASTPTDTITHNGASPAHPYPQPEIPFSSDSKSDIKNEKSEIKTLSPEELAAVVDRYTVNRIREYISHNQKHTPWPHRRPAPEFITENRHCPCGHASPCPTHETIPDVGPFPPIFWKLTPFSSGYAECLKDRNLPFRRPDEYLA